MFYFAIFIILGSENWNEGKGGRRELAVEIGEDQTRKQRTFLRFGWSFFFLT